METTLTELKWDQKRRFKSHYVVWKQKNREEKQKGDSGLNRTMQYGNKTERKNNFSQAQV